MTERCEIEACDKSSTRRGMCQLHYRRWRVHGDPTITLVPRRSSADGKGYRNRGQKGEHVVIAEAALGKPLPERAVVHHVDYDKSNNVPTNLVVCPSGKYHHLLHIRTDALNATGNANARKCFYCHTYDVPGNLSQVRDGRTYHPGCNRKHVAAYSRKKQEQSA